MRRLVAVALVTSVQITGIVGILSPARASGEGVLAGTVIATIPVGSNPQSVVSDGNHVWVANSISDSVSEIQASTGLVIRTIPVGIWPNAVSFDGSNVWVANSISDSVTEIQPSTGTILNTFELPSWPGGTTGISADGTYVWVTDYYGSVYELQKATGTVVHTIALGYSIGGISSDGTHVWVANSARGGAVTEIQASTGSVIATITVGSNPQDVASDGTHVWVANSGSNSVSEIQANSGSVVATIPVGNWPDAISSDGTNVWVANSVSNSVSEIAASTATLFSTIPLGCGTSGISSDGNNVWVSSFNDSVIEISAVGVPLQPTSIAHTVLANGTAANFSWAAPTYDGGSAITGYRIQTSSDGLNWVTTTIGAGTTDFTYDLNASSNYYFQVAAVNAYGEGPYSSVIQLSAPSQPEVHVNQNGSQVTLNWQAPSDGGAAILSYSLISSLDGVNWTSTLLGASSLSYSGTLPTGRAIIYQIAAVNSLGSSTYSTSQVFGPGLASQLVQVVSSTGQPVSGGLVTWTAANISSSVRYGLTSDGKITFPSAPAGSVNVTVTNAVMPDGSYVSGTFVTTFGYPANTVTLPPEPSSASTTITVEAPDGATLPGATVSVPSYSISQVAYAYDGTTTFTAPQVISSGTTDSNGSVVLAGFIDQGTLANIIYNDGVVTQTVTPVITSNPSVIATLPYGPVTLFPLMSNAVVTSGSLVTVTLATSSIAPSLKGGEEPKLSSIKPRVSSGLPVHVINSSALKSCKGQVLSGTTNSQGKVTLKFCAAKTGSVKFAASGSGAYVSNLFQVYVKGTAPTAVIAPLASTPQLGHASLTWSAPAFNGGSPITKYVVTLSAAGKRTVVVNATSTHVNVGGLADATRYSVSIVAVNKSGTSPATSLKVSVA